MKRITIYLSTFILMIAVLSITRGFGMVAVPLLKGLKLKYLTSFMILPAVYQLGHIMIGSSLNVSMLSSQDSPVNSSNYAYCSGNYAYLSSQNTSVT